MGNVLIQAFLFHAKEVKNPQLVKKLKICPFYGEVMAKFSKKIMHKIKVWCIKENLYNYKIIH